jgi:transposase-like protein
MHEIEDDAARSGDGRPALPTTEEKYRRIVAEWTQGNEPVEAVAARHGIVAGTLKWWRCELKRRDRGGARPAAGIEPELLPVRVTSPCPPAAAKGTVFEVALRGGQRVVRIPAGFDPADVRALVEAVEGAPC